MTKPRGGQAEGSKELDLLAGQDGRLDRGHAGETRGENLKEKG